MTTNTDNKLRSVLALRELADDIEGGKYDQWDDLEEINQALSYLDTADSDSERMFSLIMSGVVPRIR